MSSTAMLIKWPNYIVNLQDQIFGDPVFVFSELVDMEKPRMHLPKL